MRGVKGDTNHKQKWIAEKQRNLGEQVTKITLRAADAASDRNTYEGQQAILVRVPLLTSEDGTADTHPYPIVIHPHNKHVEIATFTLREDRDWEKYVSEAIGCSYREMIFVMQKELLDDAKGKIQVYLDTLVQETSRQIQAYVDAFSVVSALPEQEKNVSLEDIAPTLEALFTIEDTLQTIWESLPDGEQEHGPLDEAAEKLRSARLAEDIDQDESVYTKDTLPTAMRNLKQVHKVVHGFLANAVTRESVLILYNDFFECMEGIRQYLGKHGGEKGRELQTLHNFPTGMRRALEIITTISDANGQLTNIANNASSTVEKAANDESLDEHDSTRLNTLATNKLVSDGGALLSLATNSNCHE